MLPRRLACKKKSFKLYKILLNQIDFERHLPENCGGLNFFVHLQFSKKLQDNQQPKVVS